VSVLVLDYAIIARRYFVRLVNDSYRNITTVFVFFTFTDSALPIIKSK